MSDEGASRSLRSDAKRLGGEVADHTLGQLKIASAFESTNSNVLHGSNLPDVRFLTDACMQPVLGDQPQAHTAAKKHKTWSGGVGGKGRADAIPESEDRKPKSADRNTIAGLCELLLTYPESMRLCSIPIRLDFRKPSFIAENVVNPFMDGVAAQRFLETHDKPARKHRSEKEVEARRQFLCECVVHGLCTVVTESMCQYSPSSSPFVTPCVSPTNKLAPLPTSPTYAPTSPTYAPTSPTYAPTSLMFPPRMHIIVRYGESTRCLEFHKRQAMRYMYNVQRSAGKIADVATMLAREVRYHVTYDGKVCVQGVQGMPAHVHRDCEARRFDAEINAMFDNIQPETVEMAVPIEMRVCDFKCRLWHVLHGNTKESGVGLCVQRSDGVYTELGSGYDFEPTDGGGRFVLQDEALDNETLFESLVRVDSFTVADDLHAVDMKLQLVCSVKIDS